MTTAGSFFESGVQGQDLFQKIRSLIAERDPWHTTKKKKDKKPAGSAGAPDKQSDEIAEKSPQEQLSDLTGVWHGEGYVPLT